MRCLYLQKLPEHVQKLNSRDRRTNASDVYVRIHIYVYVCPSSNLDNVCEGANFDICEGTPVEDAILDIVPLITCLSTELTVSVIRRSRPSSAISLDIGSEVGTCGRGMCDSSSFSSCCVSWLLCAVTRSDSGVCCRSVQVQNKGRDLLF